MEKRYQVFISSTFKDLVEERQAVLKAILEIDHMPAGMELFPAADETAWQLIRDVIENSDYYVVVLGGRYGSTDETGVGFTEKEYEYAAALKIPVIPLLHKNPDNLPRDRTEVDAAAWDRMRLFRARLEKRHTCVYWESPGELKARVIVALTSATKRSPRIGWVRGDRIPTDATVTEVLQLRTRVADLTERLSAATLAPPRGAEDLLQGDDVFEVEVSFTSTKKLTVSPYSETKSWTVQVSATFDEIFAEIAPRLIDEESDRVLRNAFSEFFELRTRGLLASDKGLKGQRLDRFRIPSTDIDTCIIQFRALGLITDSVRKRSVKDTDTYWTLTPYGDAHMVQLRALRRHLDAPPAQAIAVPD